MNPVVISCLQKPFHLTRDHTSKLHSNYLGLNDGSMLLSVTVELFVCPQYNVNRSMNEMVKSRWRLVLVVYFSNLSGQKFRVLLIDLIANQLI